MIEVKMKNMTGSEVITANLFQESGVISYVLGDRRVLNHITNLTSKGWEIYEEIKAPTVEVLEFKKGRNKK